MTTEKTFDFKYGDLIEFCGVHAKVLTNEGLGGKVLITEDDFGFETGQEEEWVWELDGVKTNLVVRNGEFTFKPGETISYLGLEAEVLSNEGHSGQVKILDDNHIEEWQWYCGGVKVVRVQTG